MLNFNDFVSASSSATAKEAKKSCELKTAPESENKNYNHFTQII